jgi:hypothetical protein
VYLDHFEQVVEKFRFPDSGHQVKNLFVRVYTNALKYIRQISVRVNALYPARDHQALQYAQLLGAHFTPAEQVIFLTHGNNPQSPLIAFSCNWVCARAANPSKCLRIPVATVYNQIRGWQGSSIITPCFMRNITQPSKDNASCQSLPFTTSVAGADCNAIQRGNVVSFASVSNHFRHR